MSEEIFFGGMYEAKETNSNGSIIKVIGVGGGGGNAVKHMYLDGIVGVDFMICNTDRQVLENNKVPKKMMLGDTGLGAGAVPEVAKKLADESREKIKEFIGDETKMLFITAGMGKGTGTGAAPVVAQVAREMKILTIGVVTYPFRFEGSKRAKYADDGISELKKHVDSLIIVNNERILNIYPDDDVEEAFGYADDVLKNAVKCIAELITVQAAQNIDFNDIKTVMENSGPAMLGLAIASGPNRIKEVVEGALSCPLLDENMITNAKNFLFFISYGKDAPLKMSELSQITEEFEKFKSENSDVIWGRALDEELGDKVKLSVIVTNYDTSQQSTESHLEQPVEEITLVENGDAITSPATPEKKTFVTERIFSQNDFPDKVSSDVKAETEVGMMDNPVRTPEMAPAQSAEPNAKKFTFKSGTGILSALKSSPAGAKYDSNELFNEMHEIPAIERQNMLKNMNTENHFDSSLFEQSDANSLYNNRAD
ncbi:MAG: cell division protein FtsZ [Bacteroidales bacterium]|jgi:cell division protein FtsZ|nr:cell division protein FtsZ [Bacteroidales bacterium]